MREEDFCAGRFCRFIAACSAEGLSPCTINTHRAALLSYYTFCVSFKGYPFNPLLEVSSVKEPMKLPEYVPIEDVECVLASLSTNAFRGARAVAMLLVMTHCGLRCSEIIKLRLQDVRTNHFLVFGKGNKQRVVPASRRCLDAISDYLRLRSSVLVAGSDVLFVREDGSSLSRSIVYKIVRAAFAGSAVSHIAHPHALRHTFATICCLHGVPIPRLQRLMGHSSISTTFRYLSVVPDERNPFDTF